MKQKTHAFLYTIIFIILISNFSEFSFIRFEKNYFLNQTMKNNQNNLSEINGFISNNDIFDNNNVWSEPNLITTSIISRGDYKLQQASDGSIHCVFKKRLNFIGSGLFYMNNKNITSNEWSFSKQIIQINADILEFDFTIDNNNTIHLGFIANRENVWQVNYLMKTKNETSWSKKEIIDKSYENQFYDYKILLNNFTLIMMWISKEKNTEKENLKSSIISISKNLLNNIWTQKTSFFNLENPIALLLDKLKNNNLVITITRWNDDYNGNNIYLATSSNNGINWINYTLLYEYNVIIDEISIFPSSLSDSLHVIWNSVISPKLLNYLEIYVNGTIKSNFFILNSLTSNGHFCGLYENSTSGDLYVFFEVILITHNLYCRKREGSSLMWQLPITLTTSGNSKYATFITNKNAEGPLLGQLFFIDYDIFLGSYFYNNETLLDKYTIFQMTNSNGKGSLSVDSKKTLHYVWQYNSRYDEKLFYLSKDYNKSYIIHGCITDTSISSVRNPKIVIDSLDNIHCFFVAEHIISGFNGLYYIYKFSGQSNWSEAELVEMPLNHAQADNLEIKLDNENTIHLIWGEVKGTFQNKFYYSYKRSSEIEFTTAVIHDNNNYISSLNPNFVIDKFGTIHLVYIKIDWGNEINYILYQNKPIGLAWSQPITITASIQYLLNEPQLVIDSSNNLWLVYIRKYIDQSFLVSDTILMEKKYSQSWTLNAILYSKEQINFHEFLITENDTLIYFQQINNLPIDSFLDGPYDFITVTYKKTNEVWNQREQIAINTRYNHDLFGVYDKYSKNIYCIIYDKKGSNINFYLINRQNDFDNDKLGDEDEILFGTNPILEDSDLDGISDGDEVNIYYTNPAVIDTDWDNLGDAEEIFVYNSNPLRIDTDNDLLLDGDEVLIWFTSPILEDTDFDGLNDYDEIYIYGTNPIRIDTDLDGMPDYWEIINGLNPNFYDSHYDFDFDNLMNIEEYFYNTNPNLNDTDSDGLLDGFEVKIYRTNPLNIDTDEDTISDADEVLIFGTNPLLEDSDGDGFTDREEINSGTDPNNPRDNVRINRIKKLLFSIVTPIFILVSLYSYFEIRYRIRIKKLYENEFDEQKIEEGKIKFLASDVK